MAILSMTFDKMGENGVTPRRVEIVTTDSLATITTAGYLSSAKVAPNAIYPTDIFDIRYAVTVSNPAGTYEVFIPSITAGVVTLAQDISGGNVVLPVTANHIAAFVGTTGVIGDDPATAINGGNIQAGLSGTAGYLASFPSTAAKGSLRLTAVANTGDTLVTISNALHGQATVYTIPDIGAATGGIAASTTPFIVKSVAGAAAAGGAAAQSFTDAFCTAGSNVIGNWNTQTNAASVLKIVPGVGSFVVTSSADAGVGTFNYIITK